MFNKKENFRNSQITSKICKTVDFTNYINKKTDYIAKNSKVYLSTDLKFFFWNLLEYKQIEEQINSLEKLNGKHNLETKLSRIKVKGGKPGENAKKMLKYEFINFESDSNDLILKKFKDNILDFSIVPYEFIKDNIINDVNIQLKLSSFLSSQKILAYLIPYFDLYIRRVTINLKEFNPPNPNEPMRNTPILTFKQNKPKRKIEPLSNSVNTNARKNRNRRQNFNFFIMISIFIISILFVLFFVKSKF